MSRPCRLRTKTTTGSMTTELPMILFILFILLIFPLIDLATIGLRAATVFSATREAARAAGRSQSYLADSTTQGPSATTNAKNKAINAAGHQAKIEASDVQVFIVGTPLKGGAPIRQKSPLAEAKPDEYIYQIEVEVKGSVEPLVKLDPKIFGPVEGLTTPITVTARNSEFSEYPMGLTK